MTPALVLVLALLAGDASTCSAPEVAAYESRGWDAIECDADKALAAEDEWAGDTCGETDEGCGPGAGIGADTEGE